MGDKHEGEKLLGQLPGTGGDFIDDTDVEGHAQINPADGSEGVAKRRGRGRRRAATDEVVKRDGDDVEGHLYRGGPTTQGEIVMRGPGRQPARRALNHPNLQRLDGRSLADRPFRFRAQAPLSAVAASRLLTSNGVIPGWAARIRAA